MYVIDARNVNDAYRKGMRLMAACGNEEESRNGKVLRVPVPVTTVYQQSRERVLFDPKRNANPFFHLFESLWMLNGQRDLETLTFFIKRFAEFSDDGETLYGAYGNRWRHWPVTSKWNNTANTDQLVTAIAMLKNDTTSRRVVISMWDAARDLGKNSKDIPCNLLIKCAIVFGDLDIQVFCRSNDIVYGCYGANAVQMSMLHEYLAAMIGVPIGRYYQISGDYHAYQTVPYVWNNYWPLTQHEDIDWTDDDVHWENPYDQIHKGSTGDVTLSVMSLVHDVASFDAELSVIMMAVKYRQMSTLIPSTFKNRFFAEVAIPMYQAFDHHKSGRTRDGMELLYKLTSPYTNPNDWLIAGRQWLERRVDLTNRAFGTSEG